MVAFVTIARTIILMYIRRVLVVHNRIISMAFNIIAVQQRYYKIILCDLWYTPAYWVIRNGSSDACTPGSRQILRHVHYLFIYLKQYRQSPILHLKYYYIPSKL